MKYLKREYWKDVVWRGGMKCSYLPCFLYAENAIDMSEVSLCSKLTYQCFTTTLCMCV